MKKHFQLLMSALPNFSEYTLIISFEPWQAREIDLWLPDHKCWNHHLVFSLFQQPLPSHIVNTEIIDDDGFDFLCCPLAPNGICTTKSAYKLCLQELYTQPSNAPLDVSYDLKFFLKIN